MTSDIFNVEGFHTTLGREFGVAVKEVTGELASGADCYSAVAEVMAGPLRPESFADLTPTQLDDLANAFNEFFECRGFTALQMAKVVERLLWHWPPVPMPPDTSLERTRDR